METKDRDKIRKAAEKVNLPIKVLHEHSQFYLEGQGETPIAVCVDREKANFLRIVANNIIALLNALDEAESDYGALEDLSEKWSIENDMKENIIDDLRTENTRLREALKKYGRHRGSCNVNFIEPESGGHFYKVCTCGLKEALTQKGSG